MAKGKEKKLKELDPMDTVNNLELEKFAERFAPEGEDWKTWTHPKTNIVYAVTLQTSAALSKVDLDACFNLIEHTSAADYKKSKSGWKPRSKRKEMKLLDLKYLLVKNSDGQVEGFVSLMPTYEDGHAVVYCYEIHLDPALQGTGLGKLLMGYLEIIGSKIPDVTKVMLTVFGCNEKGVRFYQKLGYTKDEFSPPPKILRNGAKIENDYLILSRAISR